VRPNNSFKPSPLRGLGRASYDHCSAVAATLPGLTQALGAAMKVFASALLLVSISGCAMTAHPTPAELAGNPSRYDDRQIVTCGQVVTGGGKCHLKASGKEIWLSSASALCAAPTPSITYANILGLFSSLESGAMHVVRKANIEPLEGVCPASGT